MITKEKIQEVCEKAFEKQVYSKILIPHNKNEFQAI